MDKENIKRILYALYKDCEGSTILNEETKILNEALKKIQALN